MFFPVHGDPFYDKVSLLLPMTGENDSTTFNDFSYSPKTVTAVDNAKVSTAQTKWWNSSAYFDGTGDYLTVPDSEDFSFADGDFTIEFWIRFSTVPGSGSFTSILSQRASSTSDISFSIIYGGTDKWDFAYSTSGTSSTSTAGLTTSSPSANTWTYYAFVRNGSNLDLYSNGNKQTTKSIGTSTLFNSSSELMIGARNQVSAPGLFFNGYMQDLRITKGIARYTANFIRPSGPFPPGYKLPSDYIIRQSSFNEISRLGL